MKKISKRAKTALSACSEIFVQELYVVANVLLDANRDQKIMVTRIAAKRHRVRRSVESIVS